MPANAVVLVQQDFLVTLIDGTGSPVDLGVIYGDKSFSCSEIVNLFEAIVIDAGRTFLGVRKGNRKPVTGTFSAYDVNFTSADVADATANLDDFSALLNGFSANLSTNTDGYDFPMCNFSISATVNSVVHSLTFAQCVLRLTRSAGEPNKVDAAFECHGGVTRV
jgi:hypothetical protein